MVGTDKDPITSPKNQNFYFFTLKAYFSAHKFALKHDKKQFAICLATNWLYLALLLFFALKQGLTIEESLWKVAVFTAIGLTGFMLF